MLNVTKNAEKGFKMTCKYAKYGIDIVDVENIFKACNVTPTEEIYNLLIMAYHVGVVQGNKIAKKEAAQ